MEVEGAIIGAPAGAVAARAVARKNERATRSFRKLMSKYVIFRGLNVEECLKREEFRKLWRHELMESLHPLDCRIQGDRYACTNDNADSHYFLGKNRLKENQNVPPSFTIPLKTSTRHPKR